MRRHPPPSGVPSCVESYVTLINGKPDPSPQLPRQSPLAQRARLRVIPSLWGPGIDYSDFAWEPLEDGVEIFPLYGDKTKGAAAALLRYQGGARVPRHKHSDWEHIIVLQGSQSDEAAEYPVGTLVLNGPNSEHAVVSSDGCVVLVIWTGPVVLV